MTNQIKTAVAGARTVGSYIPAKARGAIYTLLGLAFALEAIWDIVPAELEGRLMATLAALGFGLALTNTSDTTNESPPTGPNSD